MKEAEDINNLIVCYFRSRSRSRSSSPSHSVQTSVIQSTKSFSQQHVNGAGSSHLLATSPSEALEENDGDVEMNGGATSNSQNGTQSAFSNASHNEDSVVVKDESLHEMGIHRHI